MLPSNYVRQLTASLVLSLITTAQCTCYYPGGQIIATDHAPCSNDTYAHCCAVGQVCLTNGLCMVTWDMSYWVGSCMDPTWDSGLCFQEESCKSGMCSFDQESKLLLSMVVPENGWSYSSPNIWHCFEDSTQWACGNGDGSIANETCASGQGFSFEVGAGRNPRVQNGTEIFPDGYNLVDDVSSSSTPTSTSTASASSTSSSSPTRGACPALNQPSCPATAEIKNGISTGAAVGIGLGVGIPLFVWALVATAIVHRQHGRGRHWQNVYSMAPISHHQPGKPQELDTRAVHEVPASHKLPVPELPP